jgi:hypothetical protein
MATVPRRVVRATCCLSIVLVLTFSACPLLLREATSVASSAKSITLEWDPPADAPPFGPLAVAGYKVYVRHHGSTEWRPCGLVPAGEHPHVELLHADLRDGHFDFAVTTISQAGAESPLHSSLDAETSPFGGWYLVWTRGEP